MEKVCDNVGKNVMPEQSILVFDECDHSKSSLPSFFFPSFLPSFPFPFLAYNNSFSGVVQYQGYKMPDIPAGIPAVVYLYIWFVSYGTICTLGISLKIIQHRYSSISCSYYSYNIIDVWELDLGGSLRKRLSTAKRLRINGVLSV